MDKEKWYNMLNLNKNHQLFLSKDFEFFNAFEKIEFKTSGLLKSNYSTPGTKFLVIFNNLDTILQTLEKSISSVDKQISSVTQLIIDSLYHIDPFISSVIASEITNYYNSLLAIKDNNTNQLKNIKNELLSLESLLENDDLYHKYFETKINDQEKYIDSIAPYTSIEDEITFLEKLVNCQQCAVSGHAYIEHEIKILTTKMHTLEKNTLSLFQIHNSVAEYISNLIDSLIRYHYYFDIYFGTIKKSDLKKKDIAFWSTAFNVQFKVPNYLIYACYENNSSILPLSSNLSENQILECLDILKENNRIVYLNEYEICTLNDVLSIYFYYFTKENICIRKCANCGKYFIPAIRCDSKYCTNISPTNPLKTCREIGAKNFYKERQSSDPIKKEYFKTKATLSKRISRCNKDDPKKLNKLQKTLDQFISNYEKQNKKYKAHKISQEEFIDWIISQKNINTKGGEHNEHNGT